MSLFSRFRKVSPPPAAAAPRETPPPAAPVAADVAALAEREEARLTAAIAAGDFQTVAALVLDGTSTKIRQRAAEAIEDPAQIRQLLRDARGGKDKSVYKILTRKRDALLAQERELQHLQEEVNTVAAALERHSHRPYDALFTPTLEQLESRWKAVVQHAPAELAQKTQQAIDTARETIAEHLRQVAAAAARELAEANAAALAQKKREQEEQAAAAAAAERARIEEEERKAKEAEAHALRQIGGLLRKAHGALASGSSRTAAGLRRAIEEKLAGAPPLPTHLASQLRQLDEKLQEINDWKRFSVAPKRAELIERMEALIGATLHPSALAGHIKDLQEQWRMITKGTHEDVEADWKRFNEAAHKAYQPCREFFEAQAKIKQENLRQREQVFERLAAFEAQHDWQQPDWRAVATTLREARQSWRQHSPVDPTQAQELQGKFNQLTAAIQARLDVEYARNVKEKRSLIARVRGLLQSSDIRKAIDEVKRLQEQWKTVGPVPRDEDRKLWEEFRQQCDALFQRRQQESASQAEAWEARRTQAVGLCEEVEKIAALTGQELVENVKRLPELRVAFDAIGDLHRTHARQLQDRFERAFERCHQAVAQQQAREAEEGWTHLLDAANAVRAYRLAVARQADAAEADALKTAAEERINSAARSPKRGIEALKGALARGADNDLVANERALRTLCIRAELLTDSPTPEADQALRREYQMQLLMNNMGQGIKAEAGQIDALTLEWLGAGPVEEGVYLPLLERFKACRSKALPASKR
jgi:hypothetical protein